MSDTATMWKYVADIHIALGTNDVELAKTAVMALNNTENIDIDVVHTINDHLMDRACGMRTEANETYVYIVDNLKCVESCDYLRKFIAAQIALNTRDDVKMNEILDSALADGIVFADVRVEKRYLYFSTLLRICQALNDYDRMKQIRDTIE